MDWTLGRSSSPSAASTAPEAFYVDQLGFGLDVGMTTGPDFHASAASPGSACSMRPNQARGRRQARSGLQLASTT
jgi:hypothetical protein